MQALTSGALTLCPALSISSSPGPLLQPVPFPERHPFCASFCMRSHVEELRFFPVLA